MTAITWQRSFANRAVNPIYRARIQLLQRAMSDFVSSRTDENRARYEAAHREEQRFANKENFGGKLARMVFDTAPLRLSHFGESVLKSVAAAVRAVMPTRRDGNGRSAAPASRTTGHNAKKSAAGDSGDPDPERPHTTNPALFGLDAASFGGAAA